MITQNRHYYKHVITLAIVLLLSGCASINYYRQSIQGQIEVLQKRQAIHDVLKEDNISYALRNKLNTVLVYKISGTAPDIFLSSN